MTYAREIKCSSFIIQPTHKWSIFYIYSRPRRLLTHAHLSKTKRNFPIHHKKGVAGTQKKLQITYICAWARRSGALSRGQREWVSEWEKAQQQHLPLVIISSRGLWALNFRRDGCRHGDNRPVKDEPGVCLLLRGRQQCVASGRAACANRWARERERERGTNKLLQGAATLCSRPRGTAVKYGQARRT